MGSVEYAVLREMSICSCVLREMHSGSAWPFPDHRSRCAAGGGRTAGIDERVGQLHVCTLSAWEEAQSAAERVKATLNYAWP